MSSEGEAAKDDAEKERYIYPSPDTLPGQRESEPDDLQEPDSRFVTLCSLPLEEASALCVRLEAHGLVCELASRAAAEDPVTVVVRDEDLSAAQEILRRPAEADEVGSPQDKQEQVEFYDRHWLCPKCRERTLEVVPLSAGALWFRLCCVLVVISPLLVMLLRWVLPLPSLIQATDHAPQWLLYIWMLTFVALIFTAAIPRAKYCPKCGWRLGRSDAVE